MFKKLLLFVITVSMVFAFGSSASARSGYLTSVNNMYGTSYACELCHGGSKSERIGYGVDIEAALGGATNVKSAAIEAAILAVEGSDSDGDGYTNVEELTAASNPSDANSTPGGGPVDCSLYDVDSDNYFGFGPYSTECPYSDCNDNDPAVNPGATEICGDGIDNDCVGGDEACPPVDADGDGYDETIDCNDNDASINPGAAEICGDGIDNDCVGGDEPCAPVDADGDGYDETVDCNDNDASINPGATEICGDDIDNNCDGWAEGTDGDLDGYFAFGSYSTVDCGIGDCNDTDPDVNPDAAEICGDGIDNDCVGGDEPCAPVDADGDGYDETVDCNDNDASINPGEIEACTDAKDNDCNGAIDCLDTGCASDPACEEPTPTCTDADGDGYSAEGGDCGAADCVDTNPDINPGACDIKSDGIDQDCSGKDRTKGKACPGGTPEPPAEDEICDDGIDNNGDGKTDCADKGDCNKDPAC